MAYIPFPQRPPTPNGYQIAGQAVQQIGQAFADDDDRQQKLRALMADMTQKRAAAILARQEAEMRNKKIEQETKLKGEEDQRAHDFALAAAQGKVISPTLAKDPSLARRSQPGAPAPTMRAQTPAQPGELPAQAVTGDDATAMMGRALDAYPGDAAAGAVPFTREELAQRALEMRQISPKDFLSATDPDRGGRGNARASYRDIEIPETALPAWDRSLTWFNRARRMDPAVNQIDLMERFVQEQIDDGITRDMARQIQTKASSRINQVYGTGIRNPWQGIEKMVGAGKAATEARELGIEVPGGTRGGTAWSKDTRQAIQGIVDKAKQDYNFKEHTASIAGAQKVLEAAPMAADTPAALAASITAVARMMAPGVVTDRDFAVLTDYGAPVGVRTWDQVAQWVTGQPPDQKAEVIAGISEVLKHAAQRTSSDILNIAYESTRASGLNVDKDQLWQFIAPTTARQYLNMGERPSQDPAPKPRPKPSAPAAIPSRGRFKALDAKTAAEYLRRAGGDRKKARTMLAKDGYNVGN